MNKSDFTLSEILRDHFRLGSLVIFIDNSYTTDEKGKSALPTFDEGLGIFKVIDCQKAFPTHFDIPGSCSPINNMKVRNIMTGKIYHCSNVNVYSIMNGKNKNNEDTVIYKGVRLPVSQVFVNPFPFL